MLAKIHEGTLNPKSVKFYVNIKIEEISIHACMYIIDLMYLQINISGELFVGLLDLSLLIPKDERANRFWEDVKRHTEAPPFNIPPLSHDEVVS